MPLALADVDMRAWARRAAGSSWASHRPRSRRPASHGRGHRSSAGGRRSSPSPSMRRKRDRAKLSTRPLAALSASRYQFAVVGEQVQVIYFEGPHLAPPWKRKTLSTSPSERPKSLRKTARSCFLVPGRATRKPKTRPNQREKPETALTAAPAICKLRESWLKVRLRF